MRFSACQGCSALLETIKQADAKKVEWKNVKTALAKRLLKGEMQEVQAAFESEDAAEPPRRQEDYRRALQRGQPDNVSPATDPDRKLEAERIVYEIADVPP